MSYVPSHNPYLTHVPNKRLFQDSLASTGEFDASRNKAMRLATIPGSDRGTPQNGFNITPFEGQMSGAGSDHQVSDVKVVGTVHAKKKRYDSFPYEGAPMFYFRGEDNSFFDHVDNNTPAMHLLTLAEHNKYLASNSKYFPTAEDLFSVTGFYAFLNNDDVSQARPITMYNKRAGNARAMNMCYYGETWSKAIFGLPIPTHDIYVVWALVKKSSLSEFNFTAGADGSFGDADLHLYTAEPCQTADSAKIPRKVSGNGQRWSNLSKLTEINAKLADTETSFKKVIEGDLVWQAFLVTSDTLFGEKEKLVDVRAYQKVASPVKTNSSIFTKRLPTNIQQNMILARNLFRASATPPTKIYVSNQPPVILPVETDLKKELDGIRGEIERNGLEATLEKVK